MTARREGYLHERYHFFHLRDSAGQERDFHFHEFDKIVVLLSGQVEYLVEESSYALRPWDVLLIKHHTIHRADISRETPYERIIIYLDGGYVARTAPEEALMERFYAADSGGHRIQPDAETRERLGRLLAELESELGSSRFGRSTLCDTLLVQILICLGRASRAALPAAANAERCGEARISEALTYIQENPAADLSAAALASRAHLSPYYFMRLFRAETGYSVHGYVMQSRLMHAAKQIRGGVAAGEAALNCGFADYSAFYRAFRRQFGAAPGSIKGAPSDAPAAATLRGGQQKDRP